MTGSDGSWSSGLPWPGRPSPARRRPSSRPRTRSASSAAAFLVKVSPSTRSGRTIPLATSQTSRAAIVSLLPEPAPATTASGPSGAAITAACSGVGSGTRSSRASWAGLYMTVATPLFQQRPLTFRGRLGVTAAHAASSCCRPSTPQAPGKLPQRNRLPEGTVETVTGIGGTVERADKDQIERVINHTMKERFGLETVERAVLLEHGDDPAIEAGQLMVRVFVPAPDEPTDYEQALATWQEAHRAGMDTMRRELSLRLPSARLLEFTFAGAGSDAPRITMADDGSVTDEQMSGREIVTTALSLLRTNYVFPEVAEQAATAVEARLAAGEYDNLDEITLTELLTRHLQDVTGDKHLRLRLGGGPGPRPGGPGPGGPGGPGPGGPGGPGPRRGVPGHRPGGPELEPKGHEAQRLAMRQMGRMDNFGIRRV